MVLWPFIQPMSSQFFSFCSPLLKQRCVSCWRPALTRSLAVQLSCRVVLHYVLILVLVYWHSQISISAGIGFCGSSERMFHEYKTMARMIFSFWRGGLFKPPSDISYKPQQPRQEEPSLPNKAELGLVAPNSP